MLQSKTNVGKLGRTVMFSREDGAFAWNGVSRLTEAMLTGKGPDPWSFLEAFFWLEETMTPGTPYPSDQLEKEAEARDISLKVLKRAKKALGIIARQVGNRWYCTLPLFTTTTTTGATGATGYSEPKSMAYEKHTGDPG